MEFGCLAAATVPWCRKHRGLVAVSQFICSVILIGSMSAASTWTGGGANVNWSTGGNWSGGTPTSSNTTDLIFAGTTNLGTAGTPLNQDIATPMTLNSITFNSGAGAFFLGGGALRMDGTGASITQSSSSAQSIANNISNPNNKPTTLTLDGTGSGVVTLSGIISPGNGGRDYELVKNGSSTFALTGNNTYAGGTTINGGTLIANSATSMGATGGGLTINAGTLEVSTGFTTTRVYTLGNSASTIQVDPSQTLTVSSVIGGTGALNKTGSGTMVLGGNNTFSGGTNVSAGTLQINATDRLSNTGALTISGGTFSLQTFNETAGAVSLTSGSITGSGSATLTGSSYTVESGSVTAILAGSGSLTKTTSGTVTLSGANTYTGGTTINAGTLVANSAASLGATSGGLTLNGGTLEIATGFSTTRAITVGNAASTVRVDASQTFTIATAVGGIGTFNKTGSGTLVLSAASTYSGGTNVSAGTFQLSASNRLADAGAVTVAGGTLDLQTFSDTVGAVSLTSGTISGSGAATLTGSSYAVQSGTVSAILAGSGAVTKTTSGNVTLTGTNTLTGAVTVSGGNLIAAGASGSALGSVSSVTVNSGGTLRLGANDQINNAATVTLAGGTLEKGNFSEGSTTLEGMGALTLTAAGSHLDFGTGTVGILSIASLNASTFTLTIDNWTGNYNTVGSGSTDRLIFDGDQSSNLGSFVFTGYGTGGVQFNIGGGYWEVVAAVPETSTWVSGLLAAGTTACLHVCRSRRVRGDGRGKRLPTA